MFGGVSQNTYVGGSSGAGGIPPNNNNVQNRPTVSHAPPGSPRPFTTTVAQIQNPQGALEHGVIFPPDSGQPFAVRNPEALAHLQVGHAITMVVNPENNIPYVALPTVHPATQQNQVNLIPLTPVEQAREAVRNWRAQAAVHQPGHRQMQNQLQQRHLPLALEVANLSTTEFSFLKHLSAKDIVRLSRTDRAHYHRFTGYLPKRTGTNPPAVTLPDQLKALLNNQDVEKREYGLQLFDQWMWEQPVAGRAELREAAIASLLQIDNYRPHKEEQQSWSEATLPPMLKAAYTSADPRNRSVAHEAERVFFFKMNRVGFEERNAMTRANGIYYTSEFPVQQTANGPRLQIDACCTQEWLSPRLTQETRIANMRYVVMLIAMQPNTPVAATSLAEMLMRHPMRQQPEQFTEMLATLIPQLKRTRPNDFTQHAMWQPFCDTLSNPLPDGTPSVSPEMLQEAIRIGDSMNVR
jgi:hypothetical protein